MTVYYIRVNTESKFIGVRKATWLDGFSEIFCDMFYMIKDTFNEFAKMDWPEFEKKLDYMVNYFKDKYDPKYI